MLLTSRGLPDRKIFSQHSIGMCKYLIFLVENALSRWNPAAAISTADIWIDRLNGCHYCHVCCAQLNSTSLTMRIFMLFCMPWWQLQSSFCWLILHKVSLVKKWYWHIMHRELLTLNCLFNSHLHVWLRSSHFHSLPVDSEREVKALGFACSWSSIQFTPLPSRTNLFKSLVSVPTQCTDLY